MTKLVAANKLRAMRASKTTFALIEYAEAEKKLTGIPATYENVYPGSIFTHKILTAYHHVKSSGDMAKSKSPSILERFANVDDVRLKTAKVTTLEGMTREFSKLWEHLDRKSIKANPPVNDRAYVERYEFTITDLYNDLMSKIEWSLLRYMALVYTFGFDALPYYSTVLDYSYYVQERKKFRRCKYMFCLNMFPIEKENAREDKSKRVDSRFCCDACRKASHDAKKRFIKTGSYLPIEYYSPLYNESIDDRYRLHEKTQPGYVIESEIMKKKPMFKVQLKNEDYKHGKMVKYKTLAEAKQAQIIAEKVDKIAIYHDIIRRTNPHICEGH
ncbi:hypothetical protein [Lysinibacillus tabacifolii]|uniref:Uncharacterized protein n=1 Tax=Lysinibacillus tabacifolii TaxID=1173107 RepID=A0ABY2T2N6_9BACI|nr:hypothetical protein [Lysinibacillus tabacifolii]TKI50286.1 hypothetical protein FC748_03460 [Lysinibacillus tabacifolii]